MKTITKAFCASVLAFSLGGCILLESSPTFMPPGGPPCEALPGTSEPVYLCEDDVTQGILFVREDGDDEAEGSRERPVKTLEQALVLASDQVDKHAILIAGSPVLAESIEVTRGVDLLGGFDREFKPDSQARPTIESTRAPVLSLQSVQDSMRVSHMDLTLLEGSDEVLYAVSMLESNLLVMRNVTVTLPDGQDGQDGAPGQVGADGVKGSAAGAGTAINPGQGGQNTSCPDAQGGSGGRGGDSAMTAEPGQSSVLGAMGGAVGQSGQDGRDGAPGQPVQSATSWSWSKGRFISGQPASAGQDGEPGQGGAGGGGGQAQGAQGGGGGAGGAGGCGGTGGQPGSSGQPVVGIFVEESTLILEGTTTLSLGRGGNAGKGGEGQAGGAGASGLPGAAGAGGQVGGRGGSGGDGGQGSPGGSGLAGESIGVFCVNGTLQVKEEANITPGQGGMQADGGFAQSVEHVGCD